MYNDWKGVAVFRKLRKKIEKFRHIFPGQHLTSFPLNIAQEKKDRFPKIILYFPGQNFAGLITLFLI